MVGKRCCSYFCCVFICVYFTFVFMWFIIVVSGVGCEKASSKVMVLKHFKLCPETVIVGSHPDQLSRCIRDP